MEQNINFENITLLLDEYKKENNPKVSNHLRDLVFSSCFPLVKKIANSLARRSTDPIDDITQVGSLGLIKAIEFYDPDLSKNFKAYATYLITGEIKHYLRDKISMIKVPSEIYSLYEIRDENGDHIRANATFYKQYLEGKYGADPYLENMLNWEEINVKKTN